MCDRGAGSQRSGHREKTARTEPGPVRVKVPRGREGSFGSAVVPGHARRAGGFGGAIIGLCAKGLATGEIRAHLAGICGAEVPRDLISRVVGAVSGELASWRSRPPGKIYPVVFIDATAVRIRDGAAANRPVCAAASTPP